MNRRTDQPVDCTVIQLIGIFFFLISVANATDVSRNLSYDKPAIDTGHRKGEKRMIRKIIQIDTEKCNGCGLCAQACHEGAIGMVDGKARLLRDDYCDGLGDCLPACPVDAISFTVREAAAYDEAAVLENKKSRLSAPAVDGEQESEKADGISVSQLRQSRSSWSRRTRRIFRTRRCSSPRIVPPMPMRSFTEISSAAGSCWWDVRSWI